MSFERQYHPLAPTKVFARRLLGMTLLAATILLVALAIGILGYRNLAGIDWIDALLNASMILGGMGPVGELHSSGAKVFASMYALFAGLVFMLSTGILIAPVLHRALHKFHLDDRDLPQSSKRKD